MLEKKVVSGIMLTMLSIGMLVVTLDIQPVKTEPTTWTVDDDGPADFTSIQEAINSPSVVDGDTIYVYNGTYYENIVVNKTVSLVGEANAAATIDGEGKGTVVTVTVNGVAIIGFTVRKAPRPHAGILLYHCSNSNIANNTITNTPEAGILLEGASNSSVTGNNITNNLWGIRLWNGSTNNTISGNIIQGIPGYSYGISVYLSSGNTISNNTLTSNWGGITLGSSSNNVVSRNNLRSNYYGMNLNGVSNSKLTDNNITNNDFGMYIEYLSSSIISGNRIQDNGQFGLVCGYSSGNHIYGNTIANNGHMNQELGTGISIIYSNDNTIYHNNLINNYRQVTNRFASVNIWDDDYPSGGNHWSDYTGADADGDGIGDTPHHIDANNQDNYPLMNPWNPPDIAVMNVTPSKTIVGQGFSSHVNITVTNQGNKIEGFDVIVNANMGFITSQTITLTGGNSTTIAFIWNTTDFAKGNYTISAVADTVPGEVDTADNTFTDGWVVVTMVGDVTGPDDWPDGKVDIRDIAAIARHFGCQRGDTCYVPNYDITGPTAGLADGKIDMRDIALAARHFGEIDP